MNNKIKTKEKNMYIVYFRNNYGKKEYVTTTYDVNKWLDLNNKERVADGNEPEQLTDFEIQKLIII